MTLLNNPFLIYGYSAPEYFCDRVSETRKLREAFDNGRNVTLIAPRRMGKTGLIRNFFNTIGDTDVSVFYVDLLSTKSLNDFVSLFASEVLGKLDSRPEKLLSKIGSILQGSRPKLTFNELTGSPELSLDIVKNTEEKTLKDIFEYLKSSGKRCLIALDEFQQITEYPQTGVEALLRSYIQFVPNVNFIFSGSRQHLMREMFLSAGRPFFQSTQLMLLQPIDRERYFSFASDFFTPSGRKLPREEFDFIYDRFLGCTWYIQVILNRLWGFAADVDHRVVLEALKQVVEENSFAYNDILKTYPDAAVRLLRAVAQEHCVKELLASSFLSKYNLGAASSISSISKKLLSNELLYKTDDGYIVYDHLMAEWLRNINTNLTSI